MVFNRTEEVKYAMKKWVLCGVGLVVLWVVVYCAWGYYIERFMHTIPDAVDTTDIDDNTKVKSVTVEVFGRDYDIGELYGVDDLPVTVDIVVEYIDGTSEEKPAYIVFSDREEVIRFEDGKYGRIIIPEGVK